MVYNETDTEQNWAQQRVVEMGGALYFTVHDGTHGWELWRTDGTESGTELIVDVNIGEDGSWPWWLTVMGDKIYYTAWDGDQRQLWHYWENPGPVMSQ